MEQVIIHGHTGLDAPKIDAYNLKVEARGANKMLQGATDYFKTVSSVPNTAPTTFLDQIKIYVNGATIELYVYDFTNSTWRKFNYTTP